MKNQITGSEYAGIENEEPADKFSVGQIEILTS